VALREVMREEMRPAASAVRLCREARMRELPWAAVKGPVRLAMYWAQESLKKVALLRRRAKLRGLALLTVHMSG
jgi:hypothetical protein